MVGSVILYHDIIEITRPQVIEFDNLWVSVHSKVTWIIGGWMKHDSRCQTEGDIPFLKFRAIWYCLIYSVTWVLKIPGGRHYYSQQCLSLVCTEDNGVTEKHSSFLGSVLYHSSSMGSFIILLEQTIITGETMYKGVQLACKICVCHNFQEIHQFN